MRQYLVLVSLMLGVSAQPASADLREVSTVEPIGRCGSAQRITCVVDGDTLWFRGTKVRLADINTPETSQPSCSREAALGERATERLISLLNAGPFAIVPSGPRDEDRYGRKLRIAVRDGRSIGQQLVTEGLAENWNGVRGNWCRS